MVINVVLTKNISFIIPRSFYPDNAGGSRYQGCARSGIQASRHGDRKGRHYYTCVQRPGEPSYSSGDPCGRHGSYDLATALESLLLVQRMACKQQFYVYASCSWSFK